jgi:hypothetical protein
MREEQADKIIEMLSKVLEKLDQLLMKPSVPVQLPVHDHVTHPYEPVVIPFTQPSLQPADCGCPSNTVCMNVACPRVTRIVVSTAADPGSSWIVCSGCELPTTVAEAERYAGSTDHRGSVVDGVVTVR